MRAPTRRHLLVLPALGSVAAAIAIGGSASAGTQTIGAFTVSDQVTQDVGANTTTATYTITRNTNKHQSNQVDVGLPNCNPAQVLTISHNGKVWQKDPSTKQAGPLIRWPANNESTPGHVFVYSYTVQGLFDATNEPLAIKSGNDVSTGTVQGIGCAPSGNGGSTSTVSTGSNPNGPNGAAGGTPAGQLQVLGQRSAACADKRKFSFRLHHFRKARITDVRVFVNGRSKAHKRGSNITKISIARLPQSAFTIKIVSKQSTGSTITSTRKYKGCLKGHPKVTSHHVRPHH
jgi:hypothetical protein